jgi:hypothetical protein
MWAWCANKEIRLWRLLLFVAAAVLVVGVVCIVV